MYQRYKQPGFYHTLFTSFLVVAITIIVLNNQHLFVPEHGKFKIYGSIWITLAIGLLFRWRFAYRMLGFLTICTLVVTAIMLFVTEKKFMGSFAMLLLVQSTITYLLFYSESVKSYVNKK